MEEIKEETQESQIFEEEKSLDLIKVSSESDVFKVPTLIPGFAVKLSKTVQRCNELPNKLNEIETGSSRQSNESEVVESSAVVSNGSETSKTATVEGKARVKENTPVNYKEPKWSGLPSKPYSFEVIKNGVIVEHIGLSEKPYTICGRLTNCDIVMEHPSISRYHAIVQYRCVANSENTQPEGFYLFDLDSTHGTQINKTPVKPRTYYRLHVGHMIKFGGSSRTYVLQGPCDDEEEESPFTVTEIKGMRIQEEMKRKSEEDARARKAEEAESAGIDWGMGDDAEEDEEEISDINPFALDKKTTNEDSYFDDPKKTLRGWFEREGYDLEYKVEEIGQAQFVCRVHLPVDSASGQPIIAEAKVKGKKKEAVVACALEACRLLDSHGVLRQAHTKSRQTEKRDWEENDYYDSDEDIFLDRTGTIERKRQQRIRNAGKEEQIIETYDSLSQKHKHIVEEISELEETLHATSNKEANAMEDNDDSLEAYMKSINKDTTIDKSVKMNLKLKITRLKAEEKRIARLIKITKPTDLPPIIKPTVSPKIKSLLQETTRPLVMKTAELPSDVVEEDEDDCEPEQETEVKCNESVHLEEVVYKESVNLEEVTCKESVNLEEGTSKESVNLEEVTCKESDNLEEVTCKESDNLKEVICKEVPTDENKVIATSAPLSSSTENESVNEPKLEKQLPQTAKVVKRKESKDKLVSKRAKLKYDYDSTDPNYAMWLPPEDQSGDGKTKLNDKYGY